MGEKIVCREIDCWRCVALHDKMQEKSVSERERIQQRLKTPIHHEDRFKWKFKKAAYKTNDNINVTVVID